MNIELAFAKLWSADRSRMRVWKSQLPTLFVMMS